MLSFVAQVLLIVSGALAVPVENAGNSATVGKIRGVRDPIYHLYLQANSKNGMPPLSYQPSSLYFSSNLPLTHIASIPVLGPETAADEFTIGGTIQSKKTSLYLNIATTSTSYKPLVWGTTGDTTAWGLEGDTIITVQGSSYGRRKHPRRCRRHARDQGRGEAAVNDLEQDAQLKEAKALKADGGLSEIKFHLLDITSSSSIKTLADHLKQAHGDGIDFVINNAGIAMDGFSAYCFPYHVLLMLTATDADIVKTTLDCNYYKTLEACHAFLPLLKPTGRIVNLGSMAGKLNKYSEEVRNRFLASKTEEDVTKIMKEFVSAVEAGKEKDAGFPSAGYAVSKAGIIGGTRALARQEKEKGSKVLINVCCPGYVNTDMTKGNGTRTVEEGAQTPVLLAIHDIQNKTGSFWQYEKEIDWVG
ncbi:NAD(P)-binding protein [Alternaria alternata]|nr:NAD(P)-binding protein [Alternaria alternata]